MKLISFRHQGQEGFGIVDGDGIVDATGAVAGCETLRNVIESFALDQLSSVAAGDRERIPLDEIDYQFPLTEPRKIFCAGRNYHAYHEVMDDGIPEYPSVFTRFNDSFVPHHGTILKPKASEQLDYENELAAIIGKPGRNIEREDAHGYVVGYTIANEGTVRDWLRKGTQNLPGKSFYRSGSIGPWMVTADELPDISDIRLVTRRNGEVVQDGSTSMMIHDLAYIISHISRFTEIGPGDMVLTGSPGGSIIESDEPKPWLKAGDQLEFEIEGIGVLENTVADE